MTLDFSPRASIIRDEVNFSICSPEGSPNYSVSHKVCQIKLALCGNIRLKRANFHTHSLYIDFNARNIRIPCSNRWSNVLENNRPVTRSFDMECCRCTCGEELKEEKAFADSTSLHGVQRVAAAKPWYSRAFWLAACLGAWTFLFWQLSVLLIQYREYKVNTHVGVKQVSRRF